MSNINFDNVTATSVLTMLSRAVNDQARIDHICTLAFAGKTYVAADDTVLGQVIIGLADQANKHREANKKLPTEDRTRFQNANMLATMVGRFVKKQARFEGRRVSIKLTGKKPSIALVERNDANQKPKAKKAGSKDAGIKGVKDLASLLQYAVDNYGLESVVAEVTKIADTSSKAA